MGMIWDTGTLKMRKKMLGRSDTKNADRLGHRDIKNADNLGHRDTETVDIRNPKLV